MIEKFNIQALQQWYQDNHRHLPFRENANPYYIWVSEIMAQQTQIDTLIPYFLRFIDQYPTIKDLAKADSDHLHKLVEGIGYYRRFKYMLEAAAIIVNRFHGEFPTNYDDVLSLPGVGAYTAGAIMSIAYNQPYQATDGNVIRVLARYYGIKDDMRQAKSKEAVANLNQTLVEKASPRIYTQAIMELGALVCRPKNPLCHQCPLRHSCVANHQQITDKLPFISPKPKPIARNFITLVLYYKNQISVNKVEKGLLEGMYLYPQFEDVTIDLVIGRLTSMGYQLFPPKKIGNYRHQFTHQVWHMSVYEIQATSLPENSEFAFVDDSKLIPMAIAHRKIKLNHQ